MRSAVPAWASNSCGFAGYHLMDVPVNMLQPDYCLATITSSACLLKGLIGRSSLACVRQSLPAIMMCP